LDHSSFENYHSSDDSSFGSVEYGNSLEHEVNIEVEFDLLAEDMNMDEGGDRGVNDESSGSVISVFSLQIPHPLEVPPPQPPLNEIQLATAAFIAQGRNKGLHGRSLTPMPSPLLCYFILREQPSDGHCAYHCIIDYRNLMGLADRMPPLVRGSTHIYPGTYLITRATGCSEILLERFYQTLPLLEGLFFGKLVWPYGIELTTSHVVLNLISTAT
jgi:hypothetical protein